jgi:hypothetical protein
MISAFPWNTTAIHGVKSGGDTWEVGRPVNSVKFKNDSDWKLVIRRKLIYVQKLKLDEKKRETENLRNVKKQMKWSLS